MRVKQDTYLKFAMVFMKVMKSKEGWRKQKAVKPFSIMFTASDEAFAVWMYLNHRERWMDMHENNNWKESDVAAKWTNSGKSKKDGKSRRHMGVSQEGIDQFNRLLNEARKQRKEKEFAGFDEEFMKAMKEEEEKGKKKAKETMCDPANWAGTDFDWDEGNEDDMDEESNAGSGVSSMIGL